MIQNGFNLVAPTAPERIVFCISSVQKIINCKLDFIFTDGHAVDGFSSQFGPEEVNDIHNLIDKEAIESRYWKDENDLDKKRRKEAEFLVAGDIPTEAILGYAVYNEETKNQLIRMGVAEGNIVVRPIFYF